MRAVKAAAAKLGVVIEVECDRGFYDRWGRWQNYTVTADAPDGLVFKATQLHQLISAGGTEGNPALNKAEALGSLLDDLKEGVEPCTDADCEYCNPPADEEIGR